MFSRSCKIVYWCLVSNKHENMADRKQATKRAAQNLNITNPCTPLKAVKTKIPKPNTPERRMEEKEGEKEVDMRQIQQMFSTMDYDDET
jgi:hypothetical protein